MHFSTIFLPLYLMGMAASSPIQGTDGDSSVAQVDDTAAVADIDTLQLHDASTLLATRDVAIRDPSDSSTDSPSADEKSLERRVRTESGEFMLGSSPTRAVKTRIIVQGLTIAVTAWINTAHQAVVQVFPSLPGEPPAGFRAGVEDPEARIYGPVQLFQWGHATIINSKDSYKFTQGAILRFFWDS